jgi:hypothetical protein
MQGRAICAAVILLAATPVWASNGAIGLFFDVYGYSCSMPIPAGCSGRLYVVGLLKGSSASGFTGAEYKVRVGANSNADPGWVFSETFDPNAIVLGTGAFTPADPLARGVDVAWPLCQQGDGSRVLIETVDVFNVGGSTSELPLFVVKHDHASNQFFQCPAFVLCDAPVYTLVCLGTNLT